MNNSVIYDGLCLTGKYESHRRKMYSVLGTEMLDVAVESISQKETNEIRILDAGCGPGNDLIYFSKNLNKNKEIILDGFDVSQEFVNLCHNKGLSRVVKASFDEIELHYKQNSFDLIWCNMSLIHLKMEEFSLILTKLSKLLSQNGCLGLGFKTGQDEFVKQTSDINGITISREFLYLNPKTVKDHISQLNLEITNNLILANPNKSKGYNYSWILAQKKYV